MTDGETISLTPPKALLTVRIIWAALILGEGVMAGVLGMLVHSGQAAGEPRVASILLYVSTVMVVVLTLLGYFARNQSYKAGWRGDAITPAAYIQGNLVLLGMLEGAATVSIIAMFLGGAMLPYLYPAGAALLVQLINFPTGKPMQPTPPMFPDTRQR